MRDVVDPYITVPSYFRCPISLDVMKSPVSLCTGVTYDRSSIQRWLDGGNNTCPATMQVLHNKDLVPNHTLHRLIKIWSDTRPAPPPLLLTRDRANHLIKHIENDLQHASFHSSLNISSLLSFAAESEENARFLAAAAGPRLLPLFVPLLGKIKCLRFLERIILFCNVLLKNRVKMDSEGERNALVSSKIQTSDYDLKAWMLMSLKQGSVELRIAVAQFVELMASNLYLEINSSKIAEDDEVYSELFRLIITSDFNPEALDASLSLLTRLVMLKRNRAKMVRAGGVKALTAALSEAELSAASTEKVLKLLEMASSCNEGRNEICGNEKCVQAIMKKVLKVSNVATEHAVTVLWSLCCLFGDKRAAAAVAESNGMAKILLLLQSNCSPAVRQMCGDLLRVFRCNLKSSASCISWYDTKTTHIMPF
ncbi:hypothetical protein BUALT_Bualt04G0049600 [Buddleja alternifolia]|uniref:U-box domain-containing protein n=1 Tax=Buddleja alternifolia TaxID=168488 RepID=A0AAV6XXA7_9LAMI|nr:hypothetical protein BUALT_Bualt04G0049600 [Buddleja alternifolia]